MAQRNTVAAGYGSEHKKRAAQLLAQWRPGDICSRCGLPMWQRWRITPAGRRVSAIHLDHTDDRGGYRGLSHASCNTSAGNRSLRRRRRRATRIRVAPYGAPGYSVPLAITPLRTSRPW